MVGVPKPSNEIFEKALAGLGVSPPEALHVGDLRRTDIAGAHGVSRRDAAFVQSIDGAAIGPFMYLGAKHMVTGYDHLLFLVGVIFFLYRLKDVLLYVSLFTVGHSVTLLAALQPGRVLPAAALAEFHGISPSYLLKHLQALLPIR